MRNVDNDSSHTQVCKEPFRCVEPEYGDRMLGLEPQVDEGLGDGANLAVVVGERPVQPLKYDETLDLFTSTKMSTI